MTTNGLRRIHTGIVLTGCRLQIGTTAALGKDDKTFANFPDSNDVKKERPLNSDGTLVSSR